MERLRNERAETALELKTERMVGIFGTDAEKVPRVEEAEEMRGEMPTGGALQEFS